MAEIFGNYIAGKWIESGSNGTFQNLNPADTSDIIGVSPDSGREEIDMAVRAAREAFPGWAGMPAPKRSDVIRRIGTLLEEKKEELARLLTREMGKILAEARGDVQEGIDCAFFYGSEGRRLYGETTPSELNDKFCMTVRRPIGVAGVVTPWNFPAAIPCWKMLPALVCGNTIVFKPAEDTTAVATRLVQIFEEAGLPPGVVNLVHGDGPRAGAPLVEHSDVDVISFTGSCETGSGIAEICGRTLKRVSLEMGGKNAQVVMADADLDLAMEGVMFGAFGTTGQRCTATSRLLLHKDIAADFTERLVSKARALKLGSGLDEEVDVGPLINRPQLERVVGYMKVAQEEDQARVLCGGEPALGGDLARGHFFQPTVFAGVKADMRIAQEEIFGPAVAVMEFSTYEEAVQIVNGTRYGLSSALYTRDVNLAFKAMRDFDAGITYINGPTIGAEAHLPFGGIKDTGNGHREVCHQALDFFSEWKTLYVDFSGKLQKAQIDNN